MSSLNLSVRADLDAGPYAQTYAETGFVQIPDILSLESAERLCALLEKALDWRLVFPEPRHDASKGVDVAKVTRAEAARLGESALKRRIDAVLQRAQRNLGFLYYAYPLVDAMQQGWDPGHPVHEILAFLNSPNFVDIGRRVTGHRDITKVDGQATLYRPGNFLTRHTDLGDQRERVAAYTLGLTRRWEPDWGGLLAFLDDQQDVSEAYLPRFNVLTFFDVRRVHAVTAVSPFAGAGRFQVTGWFRNDPVG